MSRLGGDSSMLRHRFPAAALLSRGLLFARVRQGTYRAVSPLRRQHLGAAPLRCCGDGFLPEATA
jgi:hypothetical protein